MRDGVYIDEVLAKCEALRDAQLWAAEPRLSPRRWLQNFSPQDRAVAAVILNRVIFLSNESVDRAFALAFMRLQQSLLRPELGRKAQMAEFIAHLDNSLFCPTSGEEPNPADSGFLFSRRTRDKLGINQTRLASGMDAVRRLTRDTTLYFVDDCIGSGNQIIKMWNDLFEAPHRSLGFQVALLCVAATEEGARRVVENTPIRVFAGHTLGSRYSIKNIHTASPLDGHPQIESEILSLLERTAPRLTFNGKTYIRDEQKLWGFHEFGHSLIFEHGCPDWSLPILWSKGIGDWHPLFWPAS